MNKRRDFFRQFIGHIGIFLDDLSGVERIPLNRLKELPENIIQDIEPVFFSEEVWYLKDKVLYIHEHNSSKNILIELNEIEFQALGCFRLGTKLKQTAIEIQKGTDLHFDFIYPIVTSLFFKLASLHICHPRDVYNIDEIIKTAR